MRSVVLFSALLCLTQAGPNGYYHQESAYKASSASYRNNELQHSNDDEGYYSKDGDLEGRTRPRVNSHNQHSEYINPKLQHSYAVADRSSSFGQLHAGHGFNQEMEGAYSYNMGQQYGAAAAQSNLRQITMQLQEELARELQRSVYDHYQRASAYGNAITQQQIEADMRAMEEEIRRNVTVRLQEALKNHYGNQGIRGGFSYTILDGRLQPTANYHSQELAELTRQMEAHLMRELATQMQTYYHTTVNTEVHTRRNTYRKVNGGGTYAPGPIQQPPFQQPMYPPMNGHPMPQPHPQPMHIPVHVPDSITTIATRVQTELNEHLNRILEDVEKRYFSSGYHNLNNYNIDQILAQLQEELRANITFHFDDEIKRTYGFSNYASKYSVEDVENLRRQIEHNLMTKLNRDFNKQREKFFQTHMPNGPVFQPRPIPGNHAYYPVAVHPVNNFHYQGEIANIQRQLQETMQQQLQTALMQQAYRQAHMYGSNFNPEAHYQATLQQLSEELNRNLTRQMEHLYNSQQYQQGGTYQAQLANMRNQLQMELQRQLQHGLQQSYSRYSSWSSSSRTSGSSYRPVRGFDPNLYRNYGPPVGNVAIVGEDCMMGDDPSATRKKRSAEESDEDSSELTRQKTTSEEDSSELTQQTVNSDEDSDLTQQVEVFKPKGQTRDDLTQQVQTPEELTHQDLTQHDDLTQQSLDHQDLTQQVQTHDMLTRPYQADLTQQVQTAQLPTEPSLSQAHGLTQSTSDLDRFKPSGPRYQYYTPIYRQRYQRPYFTSGSIQRPSVPERVRYFENLNSPYRPRQYYPPSRPHTRPIGQLQPIGQQVDDSDLTQQTLVEPQPSNQYRQYPAQPTYSQQKPVQQIQPLGQQVEDIDLTQQTVEEPQPSSQYRQYPAQPTYPQRKPAQAIQPLGQQVEDVDLTQQTLEEPQPSNQHRQYPAQPIYSQRKPVQTIQPLGQQIEDVDLTQQTVEEPQPSSQYRQYPAQSIYSQQKPVQPIQPLGQQAEDVDLTQQTMEEPPQPSSQYRQYPSPYVNNQYRPFSVQKPPQQIQPLGQQLEDIDMTQQTLDEPKPISEYRQYPSENLNTQQVQDLTQQSQDLRVNPIQPLTQQTQDLYSSQQTQTLDEPQSSDYLFPRALPSQQTQDLTQRTPNQPFVNSQAPTTPSQSQQLVPPAEGASFSPFRPSDYMGYHRIRPSSRNFAFDSTQQQSQDLTRPYNQNYRRFQPLDQQYQPQQPPDNQFRPLGLRDPHTRQYPSQQVDVLGQQTEDDDFGQQGLTQQTEDEDFSIFGSNQQKPLAQLAQQPEDELLSKLSQSTTIKPQPLSNQADDMDLAQHEEDEFLGRLSQPKPLSQHTDQDLTQQTEDDDFAKLTQQDLTQQTEDVEPPPEPQTSTKKPQTSQQLTQNLIDDEINQRSEEVKPTGRPNQQQDIETENQNLIDKLKNQSQKNQQPEDIGPMSYEPRPVYGNLDGQQVQVGTTRGSPPRPPYYYYNPENYPSGRSLLSTTPKNVNFAKVEEEETETESVREIEPVEPQVANTVQQVEVKGSAQTEEPVAPEEPEVITTTAKPGFWSRVGSSIKNKALEYKEKIG